MLLGSTPTWNCGAIHVHDQGRTSTGYWDWEAFQVFIERGCFAAFKGFWSSLLSMSPIFAAFQSKLMDATIRFVELQKDSRTFWASFCHLFVKLCSSSLLRSFLLHLHLLRSNLLAGPSQSQQ
eukprot:3349291-Amphidinium_carterae.1